MSTMELNETNLFQTVKNENGILTFVMSTLLNSTEEELVIDSTKKNFNVLNNKAEMAVILSGLATYNKGIWYVI